MTTKSWIIFSVLCIAILGGLIWVSRGDRIDVTDIDPTVVQIASNKNGQIADHTYGNMNSKVVLIEYGDYQCPGCGSAAPVIKKVVDKYKDKIGFVFRNFPLYEKHPNAFAASATAEAAGLQGKYWEMHEKLYANQDAWSQLSGVDRTNYFASLADQIGLKGSDLTSHLDDASIKKKIDFDTALGKKAGITGTPSFYLNGKEVGNQDVKDGKLIPSDNDTTTPPVWSDETAFETLVLNPVLQQNGISLP